MAESEFRYYCITLVRIDNHEDVDMDGEIKDITLT